MKRSLFLLWLVALVALLNACTTPSPREAIPAQWTEHQKQLQAMQSWEATGKIALRSSRGAESSKLLWRQQGDITVVDLRGPLGIGATRIHSDGNTLTIRRGSDERNLDINDRAAIISATGWDLPLRQLPYWLKGLTAPEDAGQEQFHDQETGALRRIDSAGWRIDYEQYALFEQMTLPTRITIEGDEISATVLLRHWEPQAGSNP